MRKVLIFVNRDFVLYNFRYELVENLINRGDEVYISLPYGPKVDLLTRIGAKYIPIEIRGRGTNPIEDFNLILKIRSIIKKINPSVVLLYTTKVDIYGGIVSSLLKVPYIVNISGLGTAAEQKSCLQRFVLFLYRRSVKNANCVFFQNTNDFAFFQENNIQLKKSRIIPGSGVNTEKWKYLEYPNEDKGIHFAFIARIIKEKGIEQFVDAARTIRKSNKNTFFHVIGPCDGNYKEYLESAESNNDVIYHGEMQDTSQILINVHCTVLPSFYPEGINNVLLESASSGRPIITTDRSGCMDTVDDKITGYIVSQQNTKELIDAILRFIDLPWEEKKKMGIAGREKVNKQFNRKIVTAAYCEEIDLLGEQE